MERIEMGYREEGSLGITRTSELSVWRSSQDQSCSLFQSCISVGRSSLVGRREGKGEGINGGADIRMDTMEKRARAGHKSEDHTPSFINRRD